MKHRILFTVPNFITAGSGRAMLNVIKGLNLDIFEPAVCVSKRGGALDREVEEMGIPFLEEEFTVPIKPYRTLLWRAWKAARRIRQYGFHLWHSYHYLDDYSEPLIARFSGARAWIYTKKNMGWNRRSWYLRSVLASRVAAQNSTIISKYLNGWPLKERAILVPPGVDVKEYSPRPGERHALRNQIGVSENSILLGVVAHLVPVKGHPTLLQALARTHGTELLIAGRPADRDYTEHLHSLCTDLGIKQRVHFAGDVKDVHALLRALDVFVLPTWARWRMEGCPIAMLEAMSTALPCIATNIPGPNDVIQSGVNGMLVPPENESALAHAIQQLADNPEIRRQLGEAARDRVLSGYSIEREVRDYEGIYRDALGSAA